MNMKFPSNWKQYVNIENINACGKKTTKNCFAPNVDIKITSTKISITSLIINSNKQGI